MSNSQIERAIAFIILAAFAVVLIGTALIPAAMALSYGWRWLLIYPALLVLLIVCASARQKK